MGRSPPWEMGLDVTIKSSPDCSSVGESQDWLTRPCGRSGGISLEAGMMDTSLWTGLWVFSVESTKAVKPNSSLTGQSLHTDDIDR